jgi:hypothetical protein
VCQALSWAEGHHDGQDWKSCGCDDILEGASIIQPMSEQIRKQEYVRGRMCSEEHVGKGSPGAGQLLAVTFPGW